MFEKQTSILIKQMEDLITEFNKPEPQKIPKDPSYFVARLSSAIIRLSPPGSIYQKNTYDILNSEKVHISMKQVRLCGILNGLKVDYESGYLNTIHELIHADLFSDFLEMAEHLLEEGYKDPAAVLAGSVLEEHLRKLCIKNSIDQINHTPSGDKPKKADLLNSELANASVYNKLDQKSVTAWLDLRNKAAHGQYNEYKKEQVTLMVQSIKDFITRNPA